MSSPSAKAAAPAYDGACMCVPSGAGPGGAWAAPARKEAGASRAGRARRHVALRVCWPCVPPRMKRLQGERVTRVWRCGAERAASGVARRLGRQARGPQTAGQAVPGTAAGGGVCVDRVGCEGSVSDARAICGRWRTPTCCCQQGVPRVVGRRCERRAEGCVRATRSASAPPRSLAMQAACVGESDRPLLFPSPPTGQPLATQSASSSPTAKRGTLGFSTLHFCFSEKGPRVPHLHPDPSAVHGVWAGAPRGAPLNPRVLVCTQREAPPSPSPASAYQPPSLPAPQMSSATLHPVPSLPDPGTH